MALANHLLVGKAPTLMGKPPILLLVSVSAGYAGDALVRFRAGWKETATWERRCGSLLASTGS